MQTSSWWTEQIPENCTRKGSLFMVISTTLEEPWILIKQTRVPRRSQTQVWMAHSGYASSLWVWQKKFSRPLTWLQTGWLCTHTSQQHQGHRSKDHAWGCVWCESSTRTTCTYSIRIAYQYSMKVVLQENRAALIFCAPKSYDFICPNFSCTITIFCIYIVCGSTI